MRVKLLTKFPLWGKTRGKNGNASAEKFKPAKEIETERLLIRRLQLADAPHIFAYAKDPEVVKFLSFNAHTSVQDTVDYVRYARQAWQLDEEYVYGIVNKADGQFLGTIGFENEGGKACLGYVIAKDYWNKGYTSEAAGALVDFLNKSGVFYRIWAFCDADNIPSQRVLEKAGLQKEAVIERWFRFVNQDNQFKDCIFYALVK